MAAAIALPTFAPAPARLAAGVRRLDRAFDVAFGAGANPWRQLGALAWFLFWIVAVTGVYLFAAFDTSAAGAYVAVAAMSADAWPLAAVTRSLHRYASDALMAVTLLHLVREWAFGRYARVHRFAWLSGLVALALVFASGVGGFWLVWDRLAQFSVIATTEWLDALPLFAEPLARNFVVAAKVSDRLFSLFIFLHIGLPLALLALMWIHVQRLSRPANQPPRALAWPTLFALVLLAIARPVTSDAPADLAVVPAALALDWFYLAPHAWQYALSPAGLWLATLGATLLLVGLPFLGRAARAAPPPAARVDTANCNGCGRCEADCPYAAVRMVARSDGRPHPREARVDPARCLACGLCVGACPSSTPFRSADELVTGIDLPDMTIGALRDRLSSRLAALPPGEGVVVFACAGATAFGALEDRRTAVLAQRCVAQLPPSFVEYALRAGASGVVLTGCRDGDCAYRLGQRWTAERLAGRREPHLRASVARERVEVIDAGPGDLPAVGAALERFRARLCGPTPAAPASRRPPQHSEPTR